MTVPVAVRFGSSMLSVPARAVVPEGITIAPPQVNRILSALVLAGIVMPSNSKYA